ncbi:cytosolic iron-sulfur assembly component 2B [Lepisosteus oculatus]|uniref:Cytosolic iron-sulfur assembly component 2B n=1 Tax=Lepisosteus oculatus TaxID=7918 RepID=W5MC32_LEPOC|nr:PREDICTED: mitotic spindle-associated MMXD complex subunit MIP18 [Lepisosteus oculatus]
MSGGTRLENANPLIFQRSGERLLTAEEEDEEVADPIDDREIFDLIRSINDPEHPLSLEELNVVELVRVNVNDNESTVSVEFTPTIPHCSMATLIGLSIKVKLLRSLPDRFKIDVHITPGTHTSEQAVNKQLADKERVAAALENSHLLEVVNQCLSARV